MKKTSTFTPCFAAGRWDAYCKAPTRFFFKTSLILFCCGWSFALPGQDCDNDPEPPTVQNYEICPDPGLTALPAGEGLAAICGSVPVALSQLGQDIDSEAAFDEFGYSVALSADGSRVAVGAPFNDGNGPDAGQVRVYDFIGGAWVQAGGDIDGEAAGDEFGWSVALSVGAAAG
ncbi:MAG: FG-GAP repeat protein [Lewinellaceae bacterium]|nr:FG-GAP repeat protein [Lewinellaceae bacterium]